MADVHPGQYLNEGTQLTTLQGVDDAVHVDFTVAQQVAAGLQEGDSVEVFAGWQPSPIPAKIVAVDARVDPTTRNAMVRARIEGAANAPSPGASVRVRVPVGLPTQGRRRPGERAAQGAGRRSRVRDRAGQGRQSRARTCGRSRAGAMLGDEVVIRAGLAAGERVAASGSFKLREAVLVAIAAAPRIRADGSADRRRTRGSLNGRADIRMRSFTDIFIKHPVLAVVVNLVIVLVGVAGADRRCRCSSTRRSRVRPSSSRRSTTAPAPRPCAGSSPRRSSGSSPRSAASTTSSRRAAPASAPSRCT